MRGNSGFSLFELLTVIAIIAVVAAIAIPNMIVWRNRAQLGDGARDIYSAFQLARARAAKENAEVTIEFNPGSDAYVVFIDDGEGTADADSDGVNDGTGDGIHNGTEQIFLDGHLPGGVTIDSTTFTSGDNVTFRSNGLPNKLGGSVTILSMSGEDRKIIMSSAGRVRIEY